MLILRADDVSQHDGAPSDLLFLGFPDDEDPNYPYLDVREAAQGAAAWGEFLGMDVADFEVLGLFGVSIEDETEFRAAAEYFASPQGGPCVETEQASREHVYDSPGRLAPAQTPTSLFSLDGLKKWEEGQGFSLDKLKAIGTEEETVLFSSKKAAALSADGQESLPKFEK